MRYFEKLRHKFITEFINEHGHINRSDLCDKFGISIPQASTDINKWMESNPDAIVYNLKTRRYEAANG